MFRRLVLAGVVVAVVAGVGAAVQPAAATPRQADNGTAFEVDFADADIARESTRLTVSGVPVGTPVEITMEGVPRPTLAELFDGTSTANGVRVTVPANGSIPVDAPPACTTGDFEVTAQRLDTGGTATTHYTVTRELEADAEFSRANYSTTPDGVVPVTVETECHDVTLRIVDPDSDYSAWVTIDDDREGNHTVWIDTAEPRNASALFTTEIDANATDRGRTGSLSELNGTYQLVLEYLDGTVARTNLTISPDGQPRSTAEEGRFSVEALAAELTMDDRDERTFVRIDGVPPIVPVTAAFRDPSNGFRQSMLAAMLRSEYAGDDIRTRRYDNGTVELSVVPPMRCLAADLTIAFQRLDTGATATATVTATHLEDIGGRLHRGNYTVASGGVLPVTLTRNCHEVTLSLERTDGTNATAAVTLPEHAPIDRNETVWLDTASPGTASALFRSEVGTPTRNATTNFSDAALAPGTYRLRLVYGGYELHTANVTVTNASADQSPPARMPSPPETSPSTPDAPATDAPTPDTPTTDRSGTPATPSNQTAGGPAMRPAGTDPFGTTSAATTAGSGPGFGPVLAALALAVLAVLAVRRN